MSGLGITAGVHRLWAHKSKWPLPLLLCFFNIMAFQTQLAESKEVQLTQNLTEPLSIGSRIICTGTPSDDIPWFALNIGCGVPEIGKADIAVNFNVRLPQSYVVRNTRQQDNWGNEETTSFRPFPFKAGQTFTIEILIDEKATLWTVDGHHFCTYEHRNPSPFNASWVQITGLRDATLIIQKAEVYPGLAPKPNVPMTQLAESKVVQLTQNLTEPLSIGSRIICTGTPSDDIPWFALNIGCGVPEIGKADLAVHFNVRLPQSYVVRNTKQHDNWGNEETTSFRPFPFKVGQTFTIEILIDEKATLWAVDGHHFCTYEHRNPSPFDASWVQITGLRDATLTIQKAEVYPGLAPNVPVILLAESKEVQLTQNLTEPLSIGSRIICTGTPSDEVTWFALNIGCGVPEIGKADLAVHFNVRLPQSYVLRNTRQHDNWGNEETTSFRPFPFKVGQTFTIEILIDEKASLWAVDGHHFCTYEHRNPSPFNASWVQITGLRDATLTIQKAEVYPGLAPKPNVPMTQLAESKVVQLTQNLTEPLSIGSRIICTGTPSDDIPWFALNIGCGVPEIGKADLAVHFNVRLPQSYVVRNTRQHDNWGNEETTSFRPFPFKVGQTFTIEILIDEKASLWAVDGHHFCTYEHRNPSPFNASWVQITGLRDATLTIQKAEVYPGLAPKPNVPMVPVRGSIDEVAQNEPTSKQNAVATLTAGIPDEGQQIFNHGRLHPLLHSFVIDPMDEAREWPYPNILANENVRAYDESHKDRQLVVLNAWRGAWGHKRREAPRGLLNSFLELW